MGDIDSSWRVICHGLKPGWRNVVYCRLPEIYEKNVVSNEISIANKPISRPCTFPPAHWRLILLIHDFSLVIGGKLYSEYIVFMTREQGNDDIF